MTENEAIDELNTSIDLAKMCTENLKRKREVQGYETAIKALEEIQQYRAIGTVEECRAAMEKQNVNKELESHDEKHILECCINLMQEVVNEFAEWYRWQHGEDAIDELDEEERFCFRKYHTSTLYRNCFF